MPEIDRDDLDIRRRSRAQLPVLRHLHEGRAGPEGDPVNTLTDWRGRTIAPGATVLYVSRHGSTVYVTEAVVLNVAEDGSRRLLVQATGGTGYTTPQGPSTLTALKNVTVLEEAL